MPVCKDDDKRRNEMSEPVDSSRWSSIPLRVIITLVACFLLEFTSGIQYTFGNFLPYLASYLRESDHLLSADYNLLMWTDETNRIVFAVIMPLLGLLEPRLPPRLYFFIGCLLFGVSLFGSYWAVQDSLVTLIFCYGVTQGVGRAMLYPAAVKLALRWIPGRKGLVGGMIVAGYGGGAVVWNQVVTQWINPHNLQPDLKLGHDLYFTQAEVLSRVPTCFLLLGGIVCGTQLLCVLVLIFPPHTASTLHIEDTQHTKDSTDPRDVVELENLSEMTECGPSGKLTGNRSSSHNDKSTKDLTTKHVHFETDSIQEEANSKTLQEDAESGSNTVFKSADEDLPEEHNSQKGIGIIAEASTTSNDDLNKNKQQMSSGTKETVTAGNGRDYAKGSFEYKTEEEEDPSVKDIADPSPCVVSRQMSDCNLQDIERVEKTTIRQPIKDQSKVDYTPLEVIRSRAGWTICLAFFATELTIIFVVDLSKVYGQTFIHDDRFLAIVASCTAVLNAVGRPIWGFVADRMGFVTTLIGVQCILSAATSTFLLVEYTGGRVAFVVWVLAMYGAISGVYSLQPSLVFSLFGPTHFTTNLGLIRLTGIFSSLLSVFVASAAKEAFGYHAIFLVGAACTLTGMLINASLLLDCGSSLPQQTKQLLFSMRQTDPHVAATQTADRHFTSAKTDKAGQENHEDSDMS